MTLISLLIVYICWRFKRSPYVCFLSLSHSIFALSLDLLAVGALDSQFIFQSVSPYNFAYFYSFIASAFGLIFFSLAIRDNSDFYHLPLNVEKLAVVGYVFIILSFVALLTNLSRTNGVGLLFINPRLYESVFGQSVVLNYLYFLHLPAGILFTVSYVASRKFKFLFLLFVSIVFSLFHGIKFTILHAFMYPGLIYFIYTGFRISMPLVILALSLFSVITLYFYNIRGGEIDGIIGYLTSPTTNALYMLSKEDIVINSPFGIFLPDFSYFLSKINERLLGGTILSAGADSFVLNEAYNLLPAWYSASVLGLYSYVILMIYLAWVINFVRRRFHSTISRAVIEAHLYFTLLFSFTGWPLFSLKMIYVIMLFTFIFPLRAVAKNSVVAHSPQSARLKAGFVIDNR